MTWAIWSKRKLQNDLDLWAALAWNDADSVEALELLAREAGIATRQDGLAKFETPTHVGDSQWFSLAADALGFEVESVSCTYAELGSALSAVGPALVRIPSESRGARTLAVIGAEDESLLVLTPARKRASVPRKYVTAAITRALEGESGPRVDRWLSRVRLAPSRAARAREQLLNHLAGDRLVTGLWLVRAPPGGPFAREARRRGSLRLVISFLVAATLQIALSVLSWVLLGRGALNGVIETGWLTAWALVVVTWGAVQIWGTWIAGRLSIELGGLLKRRLLCGALAIHAEKVNNVGSGALLATVAESAMVERAGFAGIVNAITAVIQLVSAMLVLWAGAAGGLHAWLLLAWFALLLSGALHAARCRADWSRQRFAMTNDFIEKSIGNRTRVVQQVPAAWHVREDQALETYYAASERLDRAQHFLGRLPMRGWVAVGLVGLLPALLRGDSDRVAVAISIAGILQAQGGFAALATALGDLSASLVAWRSIGPLYQAAESRSLPISPAAAVAVQCMKVKPAATVLEAHHLDFAYEPHGPPILRHCDLVLRRGDRVLIEGRSGSGKSTLLSVLSGLHPPSGGLLLLHGLDRATLGPAMWRRRVASTPQFHKNHVFANTLAFNLLMGRAWPPSETDLTEAEAVCRELGLGPLLDRMPSRLEQVVGETGWQLSHGERSRIFLARAILQNADVVILDETFGALDPLTMQVCLECAKRRAPTLMVIAHP